MHKAAYTIIALLLGVLSMQHLVAHTHTPSHASRLLEEDKHPIILIRHALAPGFSDPKHFDIAVRNTQRNLSSVGATQAKHIGNTLKNVGVTEAEIHSSQWFRCLETAQLLNLGEVREQPLLNSFFQDMSKEEEQISKLTQWLQQHPLDTPLILVTHQVVITGLTHVFPDSGEIIILDRDDATFSIAQRIPTM